MMPPLVIRLLLSAACGLVVSAFGTPTFHYLITKQAAMTHGQDLAWFGTAFAVTFIFSLAVLARKGRRG